MLGSKQGSGHDLGRENEHIIVLLGMLIEIGKRLGAIIANKPSAQQGMVPRPRRISTGLAAVQFTAL